MLHHPQNYHYDTCNKMILWCWNSWHQHDSYEQDEDIQQIFDQENIRQCLKVKGRQDTVFPYIGFLQSTAGRNTCSSY